MIKIIFISFYILFSVITYSVKADFPMNELLIYNNSGQNLFIKFYPISGLFNSSFNNQSLIKTEYSNYSHLYVDSIFSSGANRRGGGPKLKSIVGLDGYVLQLTDPY